MGEDVHASVCAVVVRGRLPVVSFLHVIVLPVRGVRSWAFGLQAVIIWAWGDGWRHNWLWPLTQTDIALFCFVLLNGGEESNKKASRDRGHV